MAEYNRKALPEVVIVVPCYNESEVIETTTDILYAKIGSLIAGRQISESSYILYVDDGSKDDAWQKIEKLCHTYAGKVHGIKFAHNRGHQNAVYAGLMHAYDKGCDAAISIDADLQDDPNAIEDMIRNYHSGDEIVYGVRDNRDTDTAFKRNTAGAFYKLMSLLGTDMVPNHADFRLLGRKALEALGSYSESNLFLRGIVPDLGFKTSSVFYKRAERMAGESKYPLGKMITFAFEGITSFSVKPMRLIMLLGFFACFISGVVTIYTLVSVLSGHAVAGWGSIMISIWFLGGSILVSLGIVGEYVGKIYTEVKHRPRYIIEKTI